MTAVLAPQRVSGGAAGQSEAAAPRPLLVVLALATVLAAVLAGLSYVNRAPADDSVDVGFARDMSQHHAQAVAMAEVVRDRTRSPELRILTADIALTQQAQIGTMQAWLAAWGKTPTADGPRMAWMGAPTSGLMPGMAGGAELNALSTLSPAQADIRFLELMIPHHRGALAMASYAAAHADDPHVRALARGIEAAQTSEIEYLQSLLAKRGRPPVAGAPGGHPGDAPVPAAGHGSEASGPSPLRDTAPLAVVALGIFAIGWLGLAHLPRTPVGAGRRWLALAIAGAVVAGAVHLMLTPEHARIGAAYGAFFLIAAVFGLVGAAAVAAGHARVGLAASAALSAFLVATWLLFRLVPPPGADQPEAVDVPGLLAVGSEVLVAVAAASWWRGNRWLRTPRAVPPVAVPSR